jgi:hypothetical protein
MRDRVRFMKKCNGKDYICVIITQIGKIEP